MKKNKVEKCLVCGDPTDLNDDEELYCSSCGAPLINECTNYNCGIALKSSAAYCKKCGSPSKFLNAGIVKSKNNSLDSDDIPF